VFDSLRACKMTIFGGRIQLNFGADRRKPHSLGFASNRTG
jgi:hypothetical protein